MSEPEPSSALQLILSNSPESDRYSPTSCICQLYDEGLFDAAGYRALERALVALCADSRAAAEADRHVFAIYRMLMSSLAHHLHPDDVFRVDNLSDEQCVDLMNRIGFVFQCHFDRVVPTIEPWQGESH